MLGLWNMGSCRFGYLSIAANNFMKMDLKVGDRVRRVVRRVVGESWCGTVMAVEGDYLHVRFQYADSKVVVAYLPATALERIQFTISPQNPSDREQDRI